MTLHIQLDAKKDGLTQKQDGTWKVSLTVHPNDFDAEHNKAFLTAAMGTRYAAVLVPIGDDEQPVEKPNGAPRKAGWDEMSPSQQAGIACADGRFQAWCHVKDEDGAKQYLYGTLDMESRRELDSDPDKAAHWRREYARFRQDMGLETEVR